MYDTPLTYLSTNNRTRLEQLSQIIGNPRLPKEEREDAEKERIEIEKLRKPLEETTFEEAQDFRVFLYTKYRKLAQAGAGVQTQQFLVFIRRIEAHIYQLQFVAARKAQEEDKKRIEIGKGLRQNERAKSRGGSVSTGDRKNPWAIPIDDDD